MTLRERQHQWDRDYGRTSGIPPCCIDFVIRVWQPLMLEAFTMFSEDSNPTLLEATKGMQSVWGYIPCPSCRATGARIVVKRCAAPYKQPERGDEEDR